MRHVYRALLFAAAVVGAAALVTAPPLVAQSKALRTPFTKADFASLRWLEGNWQGTADGEAPLYERIRVANDSTMEITYYRDPTFAQPTGDGRLYLSVGRIYHTFGANQWVATRAGADGLFLVAQTTGRNNFAWSFLSPDEWTSTMRTGIGGHERVLVYHMRRVKQ